MEKNCLSEKIFSHLDLNPVSNLLKRGHRLQKRNLELRDPKGRVLLSCPESEIPLLTDQNYQDLLFEKKGQRGKGTKAQSFLTCPSEPGTPEPGAPVPGTPVPGTPVVAFPIMTGDYFMGSLLVYKAGPGDPAGAIGREEGKFYQDLADLITKEYTAQLEIISLSEELASRYEELNLFYDVGGWLKGVQETEKSIQLIIDKISSTLEVDHSFITLPGKHIFAVSGLFEGNNHNKHNKQSYLKGLGNDLLKTFTDNDFIICDQAHEHEALRSHFSASRYARPLSLIAVPINMNGVCQGALGAFSIHELSYKKFTTGDVRLLHSMAEVISILLSNTELYQNLKTFLVTVVKCLVSAIEAKDIYTRGHSERVNHISMLIANHMNMSQIAKENLNWASILHDVGKIGIPEKILTKPGKLTDEEYAEIKKHPERGYTILEPIKGFQASLDGVRFHQERYDGRGYPQGLKGTEIPLSARIIAVGDTYDAITSSRAYRKGRSHEEAVAEIKRVAGTQLDPDIVKIFLDLAESSQEQVLKIEPENQDEN